MSIQPQHNHDGKGIYPNCPACGTVVVNPNIVPQRPFHKPVTSGSVRPFGGKR